MGRGRDRNSTPGGRPAGPGETRDHDPDAVRIDGERRAGPGLGEERTYERASGDTHRGRSEDLEGVTRRDSARWGPIWAGLITALTTFLLLQLLAIGTELQEVGPDSEGGGSWVSAIIGLIAFFTGGYVAGVTSAVRGAGTGLLNGFLVWALGTVLILVLSGLGLGQILGAFGNLVGQLGQLQSGALTQAPSADVSPAQAAEAVRNGALGAFFGLLLSALASALGGFLGGRSPDLIGHMPDVRSER